MSQSMMTEDDAAWTQTLVTVTPQDDGYLREIEKNVVISGDADTPLHIDTENIILRRSLMNNTKDFINPVELEPVKRVAAECQTYLQGVPKVELPLVYREEATQTLYMRSDEQSTAVAEPFCDIIKVMNEKPLPELKMTRIVQTIITFEGGLFYKDLSKKLQSDISISEHNDSKSFFQGSDKENAVAEAFDIVNFIIDRTLWISEPEVASKKEERNAEAQTFVKYNKDTKKITIDNEVQTSLSCEPRHSNTMLLFKYNEAKNCCKSLLEDCLEKGVYPRIMVDDIVDRIITKCCKQINFPLQEETATSRREVSKEEKIYRGEKTTCQVHKCSAKCVGKVCPKLNKRSRRTKDILFADSPAYVIRTPSQAENDPDLKPSCPPSTTINYTTRSRHSFDDTSSSESIEQISPEPSKHLTTQDEEALNLLKSAFCNRKTCTKR